jgi:putative nucleotidyltransferase with HDIG domain
VNEIARLISQDQSLTAQCLHLANSPLFGRWQPVESVRGAVVSLGLRRMREVVTACYLVKLLPSECTVDPTAFWVHALAVALASQHFATEIGTVPPDRAYLAGLLHDFGVVMNLWVVPNEYQQVFASAKENQVPLAEAEFELLGITHAEVGAMLAEKWRMPADIARVILFHHEPEKAKEDRAVIALVSLADLLCRMSGIGYGYPENREVVLSQQPAFEVLLDACPDLKKFDWERFTFDMESYLVEVERLVSLVFHPA